MTGHDKMRRQITVLVVDDSAFMRVALTRIINSDPQLEVVATASNGVDALAKIAVHDPNVITLDLEMPGLNGLDTLRRVMTDFSRPVIMVSAGTRSGAEQTLMALALGAFDFVCKQLSSDSLEISHIREELITKIKAAAGSIAVVHEVKKRPARNALRSGPSGNFFGKVAAIGASTGGPRALEEILTGLPHDLPIPIVIVQHMQPGFIGVFAERLNRLCAIRVQEAQPGQLIAPGNVYLAPSGVHLIVASDSNGACVLRLRQERGNRLHVPSIDVLMESVAHHFGSQAMGIILTGMGCDGALGIKSIYLAGGFTVGQDEQTSVVYGMPKACAESRVLSRVVPLSEIASQILWATRYREGSSIPEIATHSAGR